MRLSRGFFSIEMVIVVGAAFAAAPSTIPLNKASSVYGSDIVEDTEVKICNISGSSSPTCASVANNGESCLGNYIKPVEVESGGTMYKKPKSGEAWCAACDSTVTKFDLLNDGC